MSARRSAALALLPALVLTSPASAHGADGCAPADLAALSDWNGVWIAENVHADINGREAPGAPPMPLGMKLLGMQAPWNESGWERFEAEWGKGADGTGIQAGWSFPVMMSSPAPFKFVISPSETIIASQYRDIRYIYTDGSSHPPEDELWPTPWGDSIGCWEDDTLKVETVGVRYAPSYNPFAPPLSENARFEERYRLTAPDRLEADFTITDPETLERPWEVHMVYSRHPVLTRIVHDGDVFENDRFLLQGGNMDIAEVGDGAPARIVREAAKLTSAELDRIVGRYALDGAPVDLVFTRKGERMFVRAEPVFPIDLPIHPTDGLNYTSWISPENYHFVTDADGRVTGFTGLSPQGFPAAGKRKSD